MTTEEIVRHITSRNVHNVREAAITIIDMGQEPYDIARLFKFLPLIKKKTTGLDMGGMFASNQRFIDFAIKTIEFHQRYNTCSCALYVEKFKLKNDAVDRELQHDGFDPNKEVDKGNIKILENRWIDYYLVECIRCGRKFKVEERDGHYVFWTWTQFDQEAGVG